MKKTNRNFIVAICTILVCGATAVAQQNPQVSIADLYTNYIFCPHKPATLKPMSDGTSYSVISSDGKTIESFAYNTGKKQATLIDLATVKGDHKLKRIEGYQIAQSGDFILVWGNRHSIYRHSYTADHYVYDVLHNTILPLSEGGAEQQAAFSPNGAMVSYIKDNDIILYKLKYQSHSKVTIDGVRNKIINGIPDWVNEEEFAINRSYAWSTDSKHLAFVRYDETDVREFSLPIYKGSHPTNNDFALYPGTFTYKYPKAGEANSRCSVHVYNIENRTTKEVDLGKEECYIPRLTWSGAEDQLIVFKLNRMQNRMDMLGVNARSLVSSPLLTERNNRFLSESVYRKATFIRNGSEFIIISERDGWSHLYLYDINGVMKKQLTQGDYDVTAFYGLDEATNTLFFQAAHRNAMQREVYAYDMKRGTTTAIAEGRGMNSAEFSMGCKYFVLCNSSDIQVPTYTVCDNKGRAMRTIEDNAALAALCRERHIAQKEFMTFDGADGTKLNAWMIRPNDFNASRQYPVLIVQYNGPSSQMVADTWEVDWSQTLAAEGYIVISVDTRGTVARGEEFRKCTYLQLGRLESDDMIAAAEQIAALPYTDSSRIGIWGWSYGGYMSTLCMCRSSIFKMGIAIAPVTNMRFYDTIYTERYMRRPDQNSAGYEDLSPLKLAKNLSGRYLIVCGSADDNVHPQNTMEMADALVEADKQFDMMIYPNRSHSLGGGNTQKHLFLYMVEYIKRNL